ncbi:MAG TPA: FlgD immunoglobulin-like domain containing protein, partial [Candidatus Krumholzibacteria bacterium]|nr:FlgD immunoglobulin-like domain containing protein [Candidatus Krumholzibacteria bacterium]
ATLAELMQLDGSGMEGFPIYAMLETPTAAPASRKYGASILGVQPQPFQVGGAILLAPRYGVAFNLSIYDQRGRLVRTFRNPGISQSEVSLHWDGRDDSGRAVSSGVYQLRLKDARSVDHFSLTLLR